VKKTAVSPGLAPVVVEPIEPRPRADSPAASRVPSVDVPAVPPAAPKPTSNGDTPPASALASRPAPRLRAERQEASRWIRVRGAKEHNLKNVYVDIPRDQLVVITGLSGSGKSSLAFDTIFAEGQRKYMESLSAYARQFLEQLKKPDVEEIEGIPPTIAIEQRSASGNPRSTVATTTEIYDYLRLLFARCATAYSWAPTKVRKDGTVAERAGIPISATSGSQIVDTIMSWGSADASAQSAAGTTSPKAPALQSRGATGAPLRVMILAPVVRGKKGFHRDVLEQFSKQGWVRARVNGTIVDLRDVLKDPGENPLKLGRYEKHTIEAVVDRLALDPDSRQRLAESVESALKLAEGSVVISVEDPAAEGKEGSPAGWRDTSFSNRFADPERPEYALEEISPRLFSFNSPFGACKTCNGLGTVLEMDESLIIPDAKLSMAEGAIACWSKNGHWKGWFGRQLKRFCKDFDVSYTTAVGSLPKAHRQILLYGPTPDDRSAAPNPRSKWKGVIPETMKWWETTETENVKEYLSKFLSNKPCQTCCGDRLRIEALHVVLTSSHKADTQKALSATVIGRPKNDGTMLNIAELSRLTITDAIAFVEGLKLTKEQTHISEPILKEINNRLRFLTGVGLEYLSLDRRTATLSGGEAQRIRLASQVGSGLVGACYVLDEPTIGLHQRDNARLIATLRHLADIGNSVLVVEHDEDMIRAADHVLDIGPGPGVHGGRVVAQGTVDQICATPGSLTGDYLSGRKKIDIPTKRRTLSDKRSIVVKGAKANNLKNVDVTFPVGGFICVTGVSGSGKSTLVNDILLTAAKAQILGSRERPGEHAKIAGLQHIDRVIEVDQSPIGRTPRSNPATYCGFFDDIRGIFAATKESKVRGYKPGRFSFNVGEQAGGGRCEACQGQGMKKIEMHFLPDVYVECEVCNGKRYNRETLEVLYKGKSVADVLAMTVENALVYFENHPKIARFLQCLHDVGLDYLQLGQSSTTLSGGEAQRIKLATELGKTGGTKNDPGGAMGGEAAGKTLYVLDEPTTGLHFEDIRKLVTVFDRLADAGNTLVIIEHNLDVIKRADWLVDLGPEGGDNGGRVIAAGTPESVSRVAASHTGKYLVPMLGKN
jgi:excinuclease ABC subunit A